MTLQNNKIYIPVKQNDYIEYRLNDWAKWYRNQRYYSGYPNRSTIHRIMTEGNIPFQPGFSKPMPINPFADEIERYIVEMHGYHSILSDILRYNYFERRGLRNGADYFEISHAQFGLFLKCASFWLMGRMSCDYLFKKQLIS